MGMIATTRSMWPILIPLVVSCSGSSISKSRTGDAPPTSGGDSEVSSSNAQTSSAPIVIAGTNLWKIAVKQTCIGTDCLTVEYQGVMTRSGKPPFVLGDADTPPNVVKSFKWQVSSESSDITCNSSSGLRAARPQCSSTSRSVLNRVHTNVVVALMDGSSVAGGSSESFGLPTAAPALWLDGDDLAHSTDILGIPGVQTWASKGTYTHAMHSRVGVQGGPLPNFVAGALNGHGFLSFDGQSHEMEMDAESNSVPIQSAYSIAIVYRSFDLLPTNHDNFVFSKFLACSTNEFIFANSGHSVYSLVTSANKAVLFPAENSDWKVAVATYSANQSVGLYSAGQLIDSQPINFALNQTSETFRIAGTDVSHCSNPSSSSTRYSKIDVAEILVYTREFSDLERKQTECYLSRKYKLAGPSGC